MRWCFATVPAHYGLLSLVTGIAVAQALQVRGLHGHGLKWPNDLYHDGRKLGGILLQTAQPLQQVVIGIGLNVNMLPEQVEGLAIDQPWTSLVAALGRSEDRHALLATLLEQLIPALQAFPQLDAAEFSRNWTQWDLLAGRTVRVQDGMNIVHGQAQGLDAQGQLQLLTADGQLRSFAAADVSVRW
ncbi:MAG: biotin--[acetyl-CoA-carboxylase] ligase [Thiolinea sp.]